MSIDKRKISELMPHGPSMCLIDRVVEYDSVRIKCETNSHQSASNPLVNSGKVSTIILVEYASQVAAIHAALNKQEFTGGKPAYIGSVKNVILLATSFDTATNTLTLDAKCILATSNGAIYEFSVSNHRLLAKGQINLLLPE